MNTDIAEAAPEPRLHECPSAGIERATWCDHDVVDGARDGGRRPARRASGDLVNAWRGLVLGATFVAFVVWVRPFAACASLGSLRRAHDDVSDPVGVTFERIVRRPDRQLPLQRARNGRQHGAVAG